MNDYYRRTLMEEKLGRLRKAMFVYEMNKGKSKTKPETLDRLAKEVRRAAFEVGISGTHNI